MSIKAGLRSLVALTAQASGYLSGVERRQRDSLTILCYHRVLPPPLREHYFDPELVVTPDMLDLHCRVLARHFEVVTLDEGLAAWRAGRRGERPLAAITFDDGYRDNHTHAAPVLDRHGLKATFFVISGLVGTDERPWYDRVGAALQRLGRKAVAEIETAKALRPEDRQAWLDALEQQAGAAEVLPDDLIMDRSTLADLRGRGHRIGSHSVTHPLLDQLDSDDLQNEVEGSRAQLDAHELGPIDGFCYPNGNLDPDVRNAVENAGYTYATALEPGLNDRDGIDPLVLKRWFISERRLTGLSEAASAALFRMEIDGVAHRLFRRGETR